MMRGYFLFWLLPCSLSLANFDEDTRPNILLLFPDQWRFDWDGTTDGIPLNLPTIESLRLAGTRFSQAYVPSPVCSPSRSCLTAGREYDDAGVATNTVNDYDLRIPTIWQKLRASGYWTMTAGKDDLSKATQLGYLVGEDSSQGRYHQEELGFSDGLRACGKVDVVNTYPDPHEPYGYMLNETNVPLDNGTIVNAFFAHHDCIAGLAANASLCQALSFPQYLYEDDWTASNAVGLLEDAPLSNPWALWVNFPGPHTPFTVTASMADSVVNRTWPQAVDYAGHENETVADCSNTAHEPGLGYLRCNYAAELENLDKLFAQVLNAVDVHAQRQRNSARVVRSTIVCAVTDHGELLWDHSDLGKSKPWQGAVAVPFICSGPGIARNHAVSAPVAVLDLSATLLDYAGVKPDPGMTSLSLRGLLEGAEESTRNRTVVLSGLQNQPFADVFDTSKSSAFSFRVAVSEQPDWPSPFKFICCLGLCPGAPSTVSPMDADNYTRLLYNTRDDPFDMHDVKDQYPLIAEELRSYLPSVHGFNCGPSPSYVSG